MPYGTQGKAAGSYEGSGRADLKQPDQKRDYRSQLGHEYPEGQPIGLSARLAGFDGKNAIIASSVSCATVPSGTRFRASGQQG
jgi:hypothetical protein